jgi:hypothetical protein
MPRTQKEVVHSTKKKAEPSASFCLTGTQFRSTNKNLHITTTYKIQAKLKHTSTKLQNAGCGSMHGHLENQKVKG